MSLIPFAGAVQKFNRARQYRIERSLRFNSADSAYLNRTLTSPTNNKIWTWSGWVKRGSISDTSQGLFEAPSSGSTFGSIYFTSGDIINWYEASSGATVYILQTTQVFRDPSAWYHIVCAYDSTQATASNRQKMYVNGVQITSFSTATYVTQNTDGRINSAVAHKLGTFDASSNYFSGYLTEVNFIDGQALDPTSFGEFNATTGVWQPKAYTGSYGTNGFYLNFSDNSTVDALGTDFSGNDNTWDDNGFSVTAGAGNDSLVDTPTNYGTDTGVGGEVRGNYATLNPLTGSATLSNGNLVYTSATGAYYATIGTVGVSSGKWYWEVTSNGAGQDVGICGLDNRGQQGVYVGSTSDSYGYYSGSGNKYNNGSASAYGATYTTNDVIGVALDLDAGTIVFYKNNVSQGTAFSSLSGTFFPMASNDSSNAGAGTFNFGQRPFAYTAPSGFKALCTQNLPEPTIVDGGQYFNTVLWSGNSTTDRDITVGFPAEFVWIKSRADAGENHQLCDILRGVTKSLVSNLTVAEVTNTERLQAFNADGFTIGNDTAVNETGDTYVAWNWKANGAGVTNTDGTITSTVSANPDSGFSIVTYTGTGSAATVGHGLGVAPSMVIVKKRSSATTSNWVVGATATGWTGQMYLDSTAAFSSNSGSFNDTAPTSSVFTINTDSTINASTQTYVAYCFAAIPGYSAFGSYTGNGSADGPFVYLGFRPAFVMVKSSTAVRSWVISDGVRNPYNVTNLYLVPNSSSAEGTNNLFDFTSNGFKVRDSLVGINESSETFIYAAFSEAAFKYSLAR